MNSPDRKPRRPSWLAPLVATAVFILIAYVVSVLGHVLLQRLDAEPSSLEELHRAREILAAVITVTAYVAGTAGAIISLIALGLGRLVFSLPRRILGFYKKANQPEWLPPVLAIGAFIACALVITAVVILGAMSGIDLSSGLKAKGLLSPAVYFCSAAGALISVILLSKAAPTKTFRAREKKGDTRQPDLEEPLSPSNSTMLRIEAKKEVREETLEDEGITLKLSNEAEETEEIRR